MFRYNAFIAAPALSLLLCGTAHAALTADQVWQSWKDGATAAGLSVSAATESNSGGVLTLNGVTIAPAGMTQGLTVSDMTLTEESDGTVTIRPGAAIGMDVAEGANKMKLDVTHDGLAIVAKDDAGAVVYDFSANMLDIAFNAESEGYSFDETAPKPIVKNDGKVTFTTMAGSYSDTPGANRAFGLDISADALDYAINADDPGLGMKTTSNSQTSDVVLGFEIVLPSTTPLAAMQGPADFRKALEEGMSIAAVFEQGGNTGTASQQDEFFPYEMTINGLPGKASFLFNKDKFEVISSGDGLELSMTSPTIPAPVNASMGPVTSNVVMPIIAAAPADFLVQMSISQLTLNDEVWGLFDPQAALKREPLDLNIDVSGRTTLDLLGMAEADATGAMPPIPAPEKVDITDITLKVAGAALNATGAFTFDNSMGMPMPLGEANVNVSGANALIDGLIATGIITEEDAMGARMMMGMFMAPGAEPDSLTSKIEMKEGFAIFVNGQQIQ
jgi:hypothetical protein